MIETPGSCVSCGTSLPVGAIFCPRCGAASGKPRAARRVPAWIAAGGALSAVLLALGLVLWRGNALPHPLQMPASGPAPAAVAPDISAMSPKERFDRLYNRVMQALRSGDAATLSRFAPMALAAYALIDSAAADSTTRRHAALLRLHLGDTAAARAFAPRASPAVLKAPEGR